MVETHPLRTASRRIELFKTLAQTSLFKLTSKNKHGDVRYIPVIRCGQTVDALYPVASADVSLEYPESYVVTALSSYMAPGGLRVHNQNVLNRHLLSLESALRPQERRGRNPEELL